MAPAATGVDAGPRASVLHRRSDSIDGLIPSPGDGLDEHEPLMDDELELADLADLARPDDGLLAAAELKVPGHDAAEEDAEDSP